MPVFNVAGIDIGFRKTGIAIFRMTPHADLLIAATTICPKESGKSVVSHDVRACLEMLRGVHRYLDEYDVKALFLEYPAGGSKSGRASRCMGIATGLSVGLLEYYNPEFGYHILTPAQIEFLLGIKAKPGSKKNKTPAQKRAEKKETVKNYVLDKYPEEVFSAWPKTKALAEDAYDAAAVFLAASIAHGEESLYKRLRNLCEGSDHSEVAGGS